MKVGSRIRKVRQDLGLTQSAFAHRLGLSQSVLSLIEADKSALTISNLQKLAQEFGANCMWLIFGEKGFPRNMAADNLIPMLKANDVKRIFQSRSSHLPANSEYFKLPFFENPSLRMFTVGDGGMEPTLLEGDLVIGIISEDKYSWMSGTIIGVWQHSGLKFRRAFHRSSKKMIWLVGDSAELDKLPYNLDDSPFIVKVLGKLSTRLADESQIQLARLDACKAELMQMWHDLQDLKLKLEPSH